MALEELVAWAFVSECEIPADVNELLVQGEVAKYAYKTVRDVAIFTNKRLIVRDSQGLSGKKVEIYTLPYSSINMYSTENAGKLFDLTAEVELWTRAGHIKISLSADCDVRKIDKILAESILN